MVDVLDFWVPHCLTDTVSTFSIVDFSFFIFLNLMLLSSVSEWRILPVELIAKDASDVLIMSTKVCVSALLDLRWGVCVCVCVCVCVLSCVPLFVTLWTLACQAPLSLEFSRQEYWNYTIISLSSVLIIIYPRSLTTLITILLCLASILSSPSIV